MGDGFVELRVHLIVGIQQVEWNTSYIHTPYISMNLVIHVRHIYDEMVAVGIELSLDRQRIEVLGLVVGNLLSVHRQTLGEVAETIEETYGAHVNIAVGSLLQVIAGKHTQTAGVNLQHLIETVLHAEISHGRP